MPYMEVATIYFFLNMASVRDLSVAQFFFIDHEMISHTGRINNVNIWHISY